MAKPPPNDLYMAYKALAIFRGMTRKEALVCGVILSHYNTTTGQCDPGIDRISALAGIARRHVFEATAKLCSPAPAGLGLFKKSSHGGKSRRASYSPNWDRFREIVIAHERRMVNLSATVTTVDHDKLSLPSVTERVTDGDAATASNLEVEDSSSVTETVTFPVTKIVTFRVTKRVTQTLLSNSAKELGGRDPVNDSEDVNWTKGLLREDTPPPRPSPTFHAIQGGRSQPSSLEAANEAAKARISIALRGQAVERWLADNDPQNLIFDQAVNAEVGKRGAGLAVIERAALLRFSPSPSVPTT